VLHCIENQIYVFPEKEWRGLSPNFYIHVFVSDLYIYSQGSVHIFGCGKIDRPIMEIYINLSQIYECRNWKTEHYNSVLEIMRVHSFYGKHKWEPDIYIGFSPAIHLQCIHDGKYHSVSPHDHLMVEAFRDCLQQSL
jgi:hypothetical protein